MSRRALRRIHPYARGQMKHVYAPGISFTGHSRFFFCTGVRDTKVCYDACMWTLCTIENVNVCRINVDATKIIYRKLD